MKIEQKLFSVSKGWQTRSGKLEGLDPQLAFIFGGRHLLEDASHINLLKQTYPKAHLIFASTSGEITDTEVTEDHLSSTAIAFEKTRINCAVASVTDATESYAVGAKLAQELIAPGLVHVFVVSDGAKINGTELSRGFNDTLPKGVKLTGGLAGDGTRFAKTLVGLDAPPSAGQIVAVGCYGENLIVGFGSSGGWSPFGPERQVTKASGNILFELDGQSALKLYKDYLGDQAAGLPASALRYPLSLVPPDGGCPVVRTILTIDETAQSMVFAGDIPLGARVRFMRATYEELIDGAGRAAEGSRLDTDADLAICVSCVGRRIVLGQRTEEETEMVREILGTRPILTGFYSYGELAPANSDTGCQLHNQTMTITTLRET